MAGTAELFLAGGWDRTTLTDRYVSEGCCFADLDGDGVDELVAGDAWWHLHPPRCRTFREVPEAWLPPWGGGDRHDPHAQLRERSGNPPQYRASTYDWPVADVDGGLLGVLSVGMHLDPICWYEPGPATGNWQRHEVVAGGIYESAVLAQIHPHGVTGLVTVPGKPCVAWYEPGPDPRQPWTEHLVGDRGGGWHGLGVGSLDVGGAPQILTPTGVYTAQEDVRRPWRWTALYQVDEHGRLTEGLGDVCLIHVHALEADQATLFAASPHGRGLWRWDLAEATPTRRTYRRRTLDTSVTQLHALAVVPALPHEDVDAWVVTGKRWQAHGPYHDEDPRGTPYLIRVGVHRDPAIAARVEVLDKASGAGLQLAVRRLTDGRMQIATSNKLGVHVLTERTRKQ